MNNKPIPLVTWRGVRVDNGELMHGVIVQWGDGTPTMLDINYIELSSIEGDEYNVYGRLFEVIPESLAVFTGLYDANGTPIFASVGEFRGGDVLGIVSCAHDDGEEGEIDSMQIAEYIAYTGMFALDLSSYNEEYALVALGNCDEVLGLAGYELKVIGNAYANPELLAEAADEAYDRMIDDKFDNPVRDKGEGMIQQIASVIEGSQDDIYHAASTKGATLRSMLDFADVTRTLGNNALAERIEHWEFSLRSSSAVVSNAYSKIANLIEEKSDAK